jgi:cytoskeletal protein RodZ
VATGRELKHARERAGLSIEELSNSTKIQVHKILALEQGNYSHLPAGIYLDGIVRAYAQEVGINPEPIVQRIRLEHASLTGSSGARFVAAPDAHAGDGFALSDDDSLEGFAPEGEVPAPALASTQSAAAPTQSAAAPTTIAVPAEPDRAAVAWEDMDLVQQGAMSQPVERASQRRSAAVAWLLPVFALGSAATGLYAVYVAKTALERSAPSATPASASAPPLAASPPAVPASKGDMPPVAENRAPRNSASSKRSRSVDRVRDVAPTSLSGPRGESLATTTDVLPDVTGSWSLATYVESSSYSRFAGLQLGYDLTLKQDGERIIGAGRKVSENGKRVARRAQTPIAVDGTITSEGLSLKFVERGARRRTEGTLVLNLDDHGILRGRFSSEAAKSAGRAEAHPIPR